MALASSCYFYAMPTNHEWEIEVAVSLERRLGVVSTCMLGLGAMIGAGIFVLIGHASALAGPAIVLAFLLNAGFAITVGACYAELAVAFPRTGGAYVWVGEAFGRRIGFLAGFCSWGAQTIACALYALGFGMFAVEIVRRASPTTTWLTPASESGLSPLVFALLLLVVAAAPSAAQNLLANPGFDDDLGRFVRSQACRPWAPVIVSATLRFAQQ